MEMHTIESVAGYVELTLKWQDPVSHMFRGVSNSAHQLIPSVGRPNTEAHKQHPERKAMEDRERYALERFEDQCVFHLTHRPRDQLELLALAQHHGLPTRLLDWTWSPFVALFFAVQAGDVDVEGAVYATEPLPDIRDFPEERQKSPLLVKQDYLVAPPHINSRVVAQRSVFSLHADPQAPLESTGMKKITFPGALKHQFRQELFRLGVDASTIYPDMDGIADTIKYLHFGPTC